MIYLMFIELKDKLGLTLIKLNNHTTPLCILTILIQLTFFILKFQSFTSLLQGMSFTIIAGLLIKIYLPPFISNNFIYLQIQQL